MIFHCHTAYGVVKIIYHIVPAIPVQKSNHEIDIQIFPSSSLGSVADLVEGVTLGTVEMAAVGFSSYVPYCNDFAIYDPWMFTGPEDFVKLYDSAIGAQLNQKLLETAGIRILSYNLCSPGQMYFWGNEELTTVSSYKGLKVRTNGMSTVSVAIEALEAVPTAVPWKDMYTAIQAKTLDVGLGDVENILNTNYDTIITYRYSGPKNYLGSSVCISEKTWQALSDEYRVILEESMIDACQNYGKQVYEKKVAMGEDALLQTSIQTLEMEPGEREKMTLLMREAVEEYLSTTVSPNLLKQARPFFSEL